MSSSDTPLPLRTGKSSFAKCPQCPHRLQDYASEHESSQSASVASMVGSDSIEKGLAVPKREEQISGRPSTIQSKDEVQGEVAASQPTGVQKEAEQPTVSKALRKKSVSFHEIPMVAYVPSHVEEDEDEPDIEGEDVTSHADSEYKSFPTIDDDAEEYHADAEWADFYAEMALKYPSDILPRIPEPYTSKSKGKESAEGTDNKAVVERPRAVERGSSGGSVTKSILRRKSSADLVMKSSSSSNKSVRFDEESKQIDGKRKKCQFEVGPESEW